ncbi:MAG: alpha-glucosidase/alpha-galactosidase [SAR202 cluster bacterium]|nr:alpha-glucosidase/alpha-galactosidase [SAR202 cluster bacterium]
MARIALIGAGSVVFSRRLLQDVACVPALSDATIALMDPDRERLELISTFARKLVKDAGTRIKIEATTDRRKALEGADYVLTTIRVGDSYEIDYAIPASYGVDQAVGDTIGPGGVYKALRTVPVLLDICRDMEELCPDAWLLNYTNPMAIACWAINDATRIKTVGLCHSVQRTTEQLAEYIGAPRNEVNGWVAGINHMAWFLRFERNGKDAYPALRQALEDSDTFNKDPVRFEVMRHMGYFVTESTRHMSEYVPYFRKSDVLMKKFGLDQIRQDLNRRQNRDTDHFAKLREDARSKAPMKPSRSDEYACRIIESMETGQATVINGNVRNAGLIENLLEGSCVEVPCLVDRLGLHPMKIGKLPPQLAALDRANIAVQELATKAILERSRAAAMHAVMVDPLTAAILPLDRIRAMFDQMWAAHGDQLAAYS